MTATFWCFMGQQTEERKNSMEDILTSVSTRKTPQNQKADKRQRKNAAGGFTFEVADVERLKRFLTLGSASGTYYVGAAELTRENAAVVMKMAEENHDLLVDTIVDVSTRGAAPKNDYALFALAIAASQGSDEERRNALEHLHLVARTGTHLFTFATYIEQFRGWGRSLRRAVGSWYTRKDAERVGYQTVKYRQRGGWTHRDLLRLAHPETSDESLKSLFEWITTGKMDGHLPRIVEGYVKAQEPYAKIPELINRYNLSWEMLPTEALTRKDTWEALLQNGMPIGALIRNLPRLTNLGLISPMSFWTGTIAKQLQDAQRLTKARVHPINVLNAQRTYSSGHSFRGDGSWKPVQDIVDALDAGFYASFGSVEPAGKRTMLALDVSGSMGFSTIGGMSLTPREASAALALVQASVEPVRGIFGFTGYGQMDPLAISPRQRLDDAISTVSSLPFGPTDCALPPQYAREHGMNVDTFVVYTDNETWSGRSHPHQELERYRQASGIDAKMIVVGMTATSSSIANPDDPGMLDVAGFDSGVPNLITEFSRGF